MALATPLVLMLSGQGSQKPGMGADLAGVPEVDAALACASDVLGYNMADLMQNAPAETLNDTRYAQPAVCALSVGIARALLARGVCPGAVLGFSLGQVSALAISGMLSDEDTFSLVGERSRLMAEAAQAHPGVMSALLKADEDAVRALCDECAQGEVLVPANFNCPGQIVISGSPDAVARAEQAWAAQGKRFARLATSGAFHSPLMQEAADAFGRYLEGVTFAEPSIPLVCNTDARPLAAADAREHLTNHLTHPVLFDQSIAWTREQGATEFLEAGFGGVLSNLIKRIDRGAPRACAQDAASLQAAVAQFGGDTPAEA